MHEYTSGWNHAEIMRQWLVDEIRELTPDEYDANESKRWHTLINQ